MLSSTGKSWPKELRRQIQMETLRIFLFIAIVISSPSETTCQLMCDAQCSSCREGICTECYYGYWGETCQNRCVDCWYGGCDKVTGRCIQCKPGRYTTDCSKHCSHHCRPGYNTEIHCNRNDGHCLEGCAKGKWGPTCGRHCGQGCSEVFCYQVNGICTSVCKEGWLGQKCHDHNCMDGIPDNGVCRHGCKNDWAGKSCTEKCWRYCHTCDQYNQMKCTSCKRGQYGSQCESECALNCLGNDCDMSGRCTKGCRTGFYGNSCEARCRDGCLECEQDSGFCEKLEPRLTDPPLPESITSIKVEVAVPSSKAASTTDDTLRKYVLSEILMVIPYLLSSLYD